MPLLAVKLDSVTHLRESKRAKEPDPAPFATLAELGGADAISVSLLSGREHVRDRDVYLLKEMVKSRFILEISPSEELLTIALEVRPAAVMLIGENRMDATGKEPLAYTAGNAFSDVTERLKAAGIRVTHFVAPNADDVKNAARCRSDYVELATTGYANASSTKEAEQELDDLERMSQLASKMGMGVSASGSLTYENVSPCAQLALVEQVTVGRAVVRRALMVGMQQAVASLRSQLDRNI